MRFFKILFFVIFISCFLLSCWNVDRVTHVYDGDTIKVGGKKVRLIGVNTPENEWKKRGIKEECFAKEATRFMKQTLLGKRVRLETDSVGDKYDKFGRLLAYVYLDETLINVEILKSGYGYAFTFFPFSKSREFKRYHENARSQKLGIWGACDVRCRQHFCKILELSSF